MVGDDGVVGETARDEVGIDALGRVASLAYRSGVGQIAAICSAKRQPCRAALLLHLNEGTAPPWPRVQWERSPEPQRQSGTCATRPVPTPAVLSPSASRTSGRSAEHQGHPGALAERQFR